MLERKLRAAEDRLSAAERAHREALARGAGTRAAREAAGRALDLGPGKSGQRHDRELVLMDLACMQSGTGPWAGNPLHAEGALAELMMLYGWATRSSCLRYLERLRGALRRELEAATAARQREELTWRRAVRGTSKQSALSRRGPLMASMVNEDHLRDQIAVLEELPSRDR